MVTTLNFNGLVPGKIILIWPFFLPPINQENPVTLKGPTSNLLHYIIPFKSFHIILVNSLLQSYFPNKVLEKRRGIFTTTFYYSFKFSTSLGNLFPLRIGEKISIRVRLLIGSPNWGILI